MARYECSAVERAPTLLRFARSLQEGCGSLPMLARVREDRDLRGHHVQMSGERHAQALVNGTLQRAHRLERLTRDRLCELIRRRHEPVERYDAVDEAYALGFRRR